MFCYSDSIEDTEQLRKDPTCPVLGHAALQPSEKKQVFTHSRALLSVTCMMDMLSMHGSVCTSQRSLLRQATAGRRLRDRVDCSWSVPEWEHGSVVFCLLSALETS